MPQLKYLQCNTKTFSWLKQMYYMLIALLALSGCTTATQTMTPVPEVNPLPKVIITADKTFDSETFYSLLVAEIAINRNRMDIAYSNYAQQVEKTQDLAVVERATRLALAVNNRPASLALAQQWKQFDPSNTEARYIVISELMKNNQFIAAFEESYRLLEASEMAGFYDIATQAVDTDSTDVDTLAKLYANALIDYPKTEELWTGYSILLQANNQLAQALNAATQASNIQPIEVRALFQKARIFSAMGETSSATNIFSDMVEQHPENKQLRLRYASMLVRSDLPEALKQYQFLAKQNPNDSNILLTIALIQQEQELFNEARESYQQLLNINEHVNEAHFGLGEIADSEGLLELALDHYKAVNDGDRFMQAVSSAADIIYQQEGLPASHQFLNMKRETATPQQQQALFILEADTLARSNLNDQAEAVYQQGLDKYPDNLGITYARALHYANTGKIELAERDFLAILQQKPNYSAALNAYGYTLADSTSRFTEAKELISKAYDIDSNEPAILDSMGWVEYKLGNLPKALTFLQQAMALSPDHEIAAHLGEVLWYMERKRDAITIWKQGLSLNPESRILKETLTRLNISELL